MQSGLLITQCRPPGLMKWLRRSPSEETQGRKNTLVLWSTYISLQRTPIRWFSELLRSFDRLSSSWYLEFCCFKASSCRRTETKKVREIMYKPDSNNKRHYWESFFLLVILILSSPGEMVHFNSTCSGQWFYSHLVHTCVIFQPSNNSITNLFVPSCIFVL